MKFRYSINQNLFVWFLGTLALSLLLLWHVIPPLDYYPILSDDEGQILLDARTLPAHGRLGSELLPGLLERNTQYLVLDDAVFVDAVTDARLDAQLRTLITRCAERQYNKRVISYGMIHIYRLAPGAANCPL